MQLARLKLHASLHDLHVSLLKQASKHVSGRRIRYGTCCTAHITWHTPARTDHGTSAQTPGKPHSCSWHASRPCSMHPQKWHLTAGPWLEAPQIPMRPGWIWPQSDPHEPPHGPPLKSAPGAQTAGCQMAVRQGTIAISHACGRQQLRHRAVDRSHPLSS